MDTESGVGLLPLPTRTPTPVPTHIHTAHSTATTHGTYSKYLPFCLAFPHLQGTTPTHTGTGTTNMEEKKKKKRTHTTTPAGTRLANAFTRLPLPRLSSRNAPYLHAGGRRKRYLPPQASTRIGASPALQGWALSAPLNVWHHNGFARNNTTTARATGVGRTRAS